MKQKIFLSRTYLHLQIKEQLIQKQQWHFHRPGFKKLTYDDKICKIEMFFSL